MTVWPKCFVYGLVDPRTKLVFYVGQSRRGIARPETHAMPSQVAKKWDRNLVLRELLTAGLAHEIVLLESIDDPKAPAPWACWWNAKRNPTALHEAERWWIGYGRACGWPLTNQTSGGEGVDWPNGREFTESHKENIRAARIRAKRAPHSEATIAKMRVAAMGRDTSMTRTPDALAAQRAARASFWASPEGMAARERASARLRAAWVSGTGPRPRR